MLVTCTSGNLFSQSTTVISSVAITNPNGSFDNVTSTLAANGWTGVNAADNTWVVGTTAFNGGTKGAYISNNGTNNNYTKTTSYVSHFYRDVTFPAGQSCITLTFDWKNVGEVNYDFLKVYMTNTTTAVTANTQQAAADQLGVEYSGQSTWQTVTLTVPAAYAGTTKRLVFSWRNDASGGTNPAAAVDNISLITNTPATPGCPTLLAPANAAVICPNNQVLSWTPLAAPACGSITYDVYFNAGVTATTLVSSAQSGSTYMLPLLSPSTAYAWKIVARNGSLTSNALCTTTRLFTTNAFSPSGTLPLSNDFESTCNEWTVVNGSAVNQWFWGTATNNGGSKSMYITKDGGTTNTYDNTSASIVHFYKDVTFPAGQTCILLGFDWKSVGESCCDNLSVYGVNTSVSPVAGTAMSAAAQVGSSYSSSGTWQTVSIQLPASYAGTTKRIVFSWVNDGSLGTDPPAAVDNITMTASTPPVPDCITGAYSPATGASSVCPSTSLTLSWTAPVVTGCNAATGYNLYFGTDNPPTNMINGTAIGNVTTYSVGSLVSTSTYFWKVVPTDATGAATGCPTYSFNFSGGPANDLPCNAVSIPLGTIASGDNSCGGSTGEPAKPACWTTGNRNTVWFSFVAPASGNVKVRTAPGSLVETQIAVYSGACGAGMTLVTGSCNDDAPSCGITALYISEVSLTGLTAGATYYVAVDGDLNLTGTFAITAIDAASAYPPITGQACSSAIPVCNVSTSIGDPGYQGIGFTCDDNGTGNCTGGEKGSAWYTINIQAAGSLNFNIVPNDYVPGSPGSETDYDFVLWKTAGTGSVSCANITASGGASVTACNYSSDGVTGVAPGGNAPAAYTSYYDGAYEPTVTVAAGDQYMLLIENFSNSTSGFALDFGSSGSGVINYTPPTSVLWTGGGAATTWTNVTNWGGCTIPTCNIDAVVSNASSFQPLISASMGTVTVKNITINPGAVLTLGPNAVLKICESLTNNGTINASSTSTILFNDNNTAHTLNGTLSGSSTLGNLVITDVVGGANCTVLANTNLQLTGSFTTSNATSIFDMNGKNMIISGDLINSAGATTFLNTTGSTLTFAGTAAQAYNPNANSATPTLTLNNVTMNHTGSGVTISTTNTANMLLGTSGVLTLTAGKIITPGTQEVDVLNTATSAVSSGNTGSFVQGNLRRYLAAGATGSFDFPVGEAAKGYQLANLNFNTAAAASALNLLARFDQWGGAWPMPGAPGWGPDCSATYNMPYLNNGYWTINSSIVSTGVYDITLHNLNYSNAATGWSVAKSPSSSPAWALQGICQASPVTAVQRLSMSGFSKFATIQSSVPLPVQLIDFKGDSKGSYNALSWHSATETDMSRYELESSEDAMHFTSIYQKYLSGNSTTVHGYAYNDYAFYSPISYYRLKLVNNDGSHTYSNIVAIEHKSSEFSVASIYPNPATNELNIQVEAPGESNASVSVKDITGREIYNSSFELREGSQKLTLNTTSFAAGSYMVTVSYGDKPPVNKKVVIQHN